MIIIGQLANGHPGRDRIEERSFLIVQHTILSIVEAEFFRYFTAMSFLLKIPHSASQSSNTDILRFLNVITYVSMLGLHVPSVFCSIVQTFEA